MTSRRYLQEGWHAVLAATLVLAATQAAAVDLRIFGGMVIDGTSTGGEPDRIVDIEGDRIVYVGPMRPGLPKQTLDATGKIVAPGFIDPHTHAYGDLSDPNRSANLPYLFQGVSTVFVGNDGGVGRFEEIQETLSSHPVGTNVGVFAGHGTIRRQVLGHENRPPYQEELRKMQSAVAQDMRAGALGLSTGLFYAPGSFAETDEVVALAKVAASFGGVYESHIRDEADYSIGLLGAIREAIEVGRRAGIPVHIAHIKALGPSVHGQSEEIIQLVEEAQADGLAVTADQYPWLASGTRLSNALIPRRIMTGGAQGLRAFLSNADSVDSIQAEMRDNLQRRDGADALLITGESAHQGKTLAEIADQQGLEPTLAAVDIVRAGDPAVASFMMDEDDVRRLMVQDWVVTSSDGSRGHPRKYASFPEKYAKYVQSEGLLDLVTFVHRSSGATAKIFGLCDRGFLREGQRADVLVFDPDEYQPSATYELPEELARGVEYLYVNGVAAISEGKLSAPESGRLLNAPSCLD
ncbi:MAG: amidohydrolase family protein [Gammaproteobacteria bacterium]|nr:amidohydrolase family protein [Gammaproteobacteria bacterium]